MSEPIPIAAPTRRLHPRHGTHAPTASTPPRQPGSIRRTITLDCTRSAEDLTGPITVVARGRDLATGDDGSAREVGRAELRVEVRSQFDPTITSIESTPAVVALDGAVGRLGMSGFRALARSLTDGELFSGDLLASLLDDIPTALLVSGSVLQQAGKTGVMSAERLGPMTDLCAGWRQGATILEGVAIDGKVPVVTGPLAPVLEPPDDPLAWHAFDPLPVHGMRRRRRLDLRRGAGDEAWAVDAMFRDSQVGPDGIETAIHEYTIDCHVDPATLVLSDSSATPRALPWVECPDAAASATRLGGLVATDLRDLVLAEFTGVTTCTHLNDLMRSLADLGTLVAALR